MLDGHSSPLAPTSWHHESCENPFAIPVPNSELDNSASSVYIVTSRTEKMNAVEQPTQQHWAQLNEPDNVFTLPVWPGQEDTLSTAHKATADDSKPQIGRLGMPPLANAGKWQPSLLSARGPSRTYGTFAVDIIRGRLFESETYLRLLRQQMQGHLWYVIVATLFWPIAWLLAICTSYKAAATERKDLQMFSLYLILGTLTGLVLWLIPCIILIWGGAVHGHGAWNGTLHYISNLLFNAEITTFDFASFALAQILLLFVPMFAWAYHQIALDMDQYKSTTESSWERRHDNWGHHVVIPDDQKGHLQAFLRVDTPRPLVNKIYMQDIISLLHQMPGWDSASEFQARDFQKEIYGTTRGFFSKLQQQSTQAAEKGLWSHDVYVTWSSEYEEYVDPLSSMLKISYHETCALLAGVGRKLFEMPFAILCIVLVAALRAMLPRLWLWIVLDGMLFPKDAAPLFLVVCSCLATFVSSFLWISLVFVITQWYSRNATQSLLITSLIDPRARIEYARQHLQGLSKTKAENIMCGMPLVSLMHATNVSAFWRLGEYGVLDRAKARMGMEILMDMLIIWLLVSFFVALVLMWTIQPYTTWSPVMLLDIAVFGCLALRALGISLKVSETQNKHVLVFSETRYDVAQKCAELKEGACATARSRDAPSPTITDLESTSALLDKYMAMVQERDSRDTILLGVKVTSVIALIVVALGCMALVLIIIRMSTLGILQGAQPNGSIRLHSARSAMGSFLSHVFYRLHII